MAAVRPNSISIYSSGVLHCTEKIFHFHARRLNYCGTKQTTISILLADFFHARSGRTHCYADML